MQQKNTSFAFTLAELLVVITIIGIMGLGISQFNFNRLNQKQQIEIEVVKIVNIIENVRNNALIGRGVGTDLHTPSAWNIIIRNDTSSGSLIAQYLSGSLVNYSTWDSPFPLGIQQIRCKNINGGANSVSTNISLGFTGSVGGINTGCPGIKKILEIDYGLPDLQKTIHINTLSGIIEID